MIIKGVAYSANGVKYRSHAPLKYLRLSAVLVTRRFIKCLTTFPGNSRND